MVTGNEFLIFESIVDFIITRAKATFNHLRSIVEGITATNKQFIGKWLNTIPKYDPTIVKP